MRKHPRTKVALFSSMVALLATACAAPTPQSVCGQQRNCNCPGFTGVMPTEEERRAAMDQCVRQLSTVSQAALNCFASLSCDDLCNNGAAAASRCLAMTGGGDSGVSNGGPDASSMSGGCGAFNACGPCTEQPSCQWCRSSNACIELSANCDNAAIVPSMCR